MGKFYCIFCETSHHKLTPRHQCQNCARFICDEALKAVRQAGNYNCLFCDGKLISVKKENISTSTPQKIVDPQMQISTLELASDNTPDLLKPVKIDQHDLEIIEQLGRYIGKPILPLMEKELEQTDFGYTIYNKRVIGLSLYNCKLDSLPDFITELTELELLYVQKNSLRFITEQISSFKHLKAIDLSHNILEKIPDEISEIPHLQRLLLNHNNLIRLPSSLKDLSELTCINLCQNPCWDHPSRKLTQWINQLKRQNCEVEVDQLTEIYQDVLLTVDQVLALQDLEILIGRPLPHLSSNVELKVYETLLNTAFGFITEGNQVIGLGLCNLRLKSLPKSIVNLSNLKILDLSENHLAKIPDEAFNLKELIALDLEYNNLEELPKNIVRLENIKIINLSRNQFKRLPKWINELKSLEILFLKYNQLVSLPSSLKDLKALKKIDFRVNPVWEERYNRRSLQKWIKSLQKRDGIVIGVD